jgi:pimeloyl-ACP methyl ester carboxylesterase
MMDSTTLRKWLLAMMAMACTTVYATNTTSNVERERYWADQLADGLVVGEAVWLSNRGHRFLALSATPEKPATTAVILIHGRGVHPAWGFIEKLYRDLREAGYLTLSLQMPILASAAKFSDYGPTIPEALERIDRSIEYLRQQRNIKRIIIVGHSGGAMTAITYLAKRPNAGVAGLAAIGFVSQPNGPDIMRPEIMLKSVQIPVLDIYGSNDLNEVISFVGARRRAAEQAGNRHYRQQRVAGADHFFTDHYPELRQIIQDWLASLPGKP